MKNIITNCLVLRSLEISDADRVYELASDFDVAKTTQNIPHPYPRDGAMKFIERATQLTAEGTTMTFAIALKETNQLIGVIGIGVTEEHNRGEMGYWIGKPYWGLGYATEAVHAIIQFCFHDLKLNKVTARALKDNPGSWRVMEKNGMTYEGTKKQHILKWGTYYDLVHYGIVKENDKA